MENDERCVLWKTNFMKKSIFIVFAVFAGSLVFAQQKKEKPSPPPPPPVLNAKDITPPPPPSIPNDWPQADKAFLNRNPSVKSVGWSENNIRIHLKSGKEEIFDLNNKQQMENFRKHYGELPVPPPPPPPKPIAPKKVNYPEDYYDFLKRNPTVKGIGWSDDKVSIRLKSGKEEEYVLNNEEEMQKLKNKYGELPASPPKLIKVTKKS